MFTYANSGFWPTRGNVEMDFVEKEANDEGNSTKEYNLDKAAKKSKRGKDKLEFKSNSRQRSKSLHNRRKGLIQAGYKLQLMTGAEVLIIVQNNKERRFYATGSLREEYLNGNLHGSGKEEVIDGQGKDCSNGAVVCPLEATPSPSCAPQAQRQNRILDIVGHPKSRRSLDLNLTGSDQAFIPEPVKRLLEDKPRPIVLSQEINNNQSSPDTETQQ